MRADATQRPVPPRDFVFGGVRFQLVGELPEGWRAPRLAVSYEVASEVLAHVVVDSRRDWCSAEASHPAHRSVTWEESYGSLRLDVGGTPAMLQMVTPDVARGGSPSSAALGAVVPASLAPERLEHQLVAMAAAVGEQLGGSVLHAASALVAGRLWVFVGPSGAGKSTACQRLGGELYSADRLLLWPASRGGGWASALPGGSPFEGERQALAARLPVAAVLRVRHATGQGARVTGVEPWRAVLLLREATFGGVRTTQGELARLSNLESLAARLRVGELWFGLHVPEATLAAALAAFPGQT